MITIQVDGSGKDFPDCPLRTDVIVAAQFFLVLSIVVQSGFLKKMKIHLIMSYLIGVRFEMAGC